MALPFELLIAGLAVVQRLLSVLLSGLSLGPCQQLHGIEGLGDKVAGARCQCGFLRPVVVFGAGDDDHGQISQMCK